MNAPRLLCALLLLAAPLAAAREVRIVVDPGHGGAQEGAIGPGGVMEKTLALEVSRKVKQLLQEQTGARVFLTRDRDVTLPLGDRVALANKLSADLLISIHANSMPTRKLRARTQGIETYFLSASASDEDARATADRENETGEASAPEQSDTLAFILHDLQRTETHEDASRLAQEVHQELLTHTGAEDRGVRQAPLYVLMGADAPSILVEIGFVSHPEEVKRLVSGEYQRALAAGIASGVKRYLAFAAQREVQLSSPSPR